MTVHLTKRTRMKTSTTRTIAKVITLSLLTATALHATNGDNLIGVGAKSRAMGGTGVALGHGAESAFTNPATITEIEGTEISFGGTLFMPDITTGIDSTPFGGSQEVFKSDADTNIIPSVSIASQINENWFIGAGMWGTAGMGVDFRNANGAILNNFGMVTNLQLLQFGVPIAYKTSGLSIGVTPILQYGNLDINYNAPGSPFNGEGLSQDFGLGWQAGLTYDFGEVGVQGLSLGLTYKSAIEMEYDGQFTTGDPTNPTGAMDAFGLALENGNTLEQPEEYSVGIAYGMGAHTFAFDYKKINWSKASGYGDFGWEDQDVYAFGYEFQATGWAIRLGYNYSSSAVVELGTSPVDPTNATLNMLNLLGFPATQEHHYTFGGTYEFSEMFSADLAYVYAPTSTKTFDTFLATSPTTGVPSTITNTHSEDSFTFQFNFKF